MNRQNKLGKQTVTPKKRLGQNFLSEIGVIKKLVAAAAIIPGETVLEIGPGTGNLTAELVKTGNRVVAIEKDPEMASILEEKFHGTANFELLAGDALAFDEGIILPPYKIAANLPFYMASPLIRKFLESKNPPASLTVIVQKEVAQRACAQPPKMNLLAAAIQFYAKPKIVDYISKGCFWPAPKVDCAILHLVPFPKTGERYNADSVAQFFKVMKAGFSQPRKQLAGNLSKGLSINKGKIGQLLAKNNIDPKQRPETLSVENWILLSNGI
jgi:16S rRNA (adenine1518-N6/adenine1519-N6)-dimethyltransferase